MRIKRTPRIPAGNVVLTNCRPTRVFSINLGGYVTVYKCGLISDKSVQCPLYLEPSTCESLTNKLPKDRVSLDNEEWYRSEPRILSNSGIRINDHAAAEREIDNFVKDYLQSGRAQI